MKTIINNKNSLVNKMVKNFNKILLLLMLILISLVSVNAGELLYNQNSLVSELNDNKVGNVQLFDLAGNKNLHLTENQTYDLALEYPELRNDMYIYFENTKVNATLTFIWNFDLATTGQRLTQNFTLNEIGTYVFKINNNVYGEPMRFFIETNDDSYIATIYTQQKIEKGIPEIMDTFVGKVNDLIDINLGVWKIMYYLFIFTIVISMIFLVVLIGVKMYDFAKKNSISKHAGGRSNHK